MCKTKTNIITINGAELSQSHNFFDKRRIPAMSKCTHKISGGLFIYIFLLTMEG